MAYLILIRHGQSEWNALGKWTGQTDIPLTEKGKQEARDAAKSLKHLSFDTAFVSKQTRAKQTLDEILDALHHPALPVKSHAALNERDYGDYTGLNKWDVKDQVGDDTFQKIRRSWDHPIPNGESLKDVHERVKPYYESVILEDIKAGKNVIVSAHGNSIRALVKHLESIPEHEVHQLEIGTGEIYMYELNEDGTITDKSILNSGNKA